MIAYISKNLKKLSGLLCLMMIFTLTSCTYDYFRDENNFRLFVPQIVDGSESIERFYVAFHTEDGRHAITREITFPFDDDDLMKEGILRFKLPPDQNYHMTCFADYTPGAITVGELFEESNKAKILDTSEDNLYSRSENVYQSHTSHPRSLFTTVTAFPIGHPDSQIPDTADMDPGKQYKGEIILSFIGLPSMITRVDAYYSGLASAYHFDGTFRRYTDGDRIRGSYDLGARSGVASDAETRDPINPSAGTDFVRSTRAATLSPNPVPLELEVHLFDASGNRIGVLPFTQADFDRLAPEKKPVGSDGNPVGTLVLGPQETIKFTFKDFTIINIELVGWGDVIPGGTTPM
jgi:hypothetical protein